MAYGASAKRIAPLAEDGGLGCANPPYGLHHTRGSNGTILTHIAREGVIALEPPGPELRLAEV